MAAKVYTAKYESECCSCNNLIKIGDKIVYNHHINFRDWEHYDCNVIWQDTHDNVDVEVNCCVECGIDMGPQNPRQLCGKWRCVNKIFSEFEYNSD